VRKFHTCEDRQFFFFAAMGLCKWSGVSYGFHIAHYRETVHTDEFNPAILQIAPEEHSRIADHITPRLIQWWALRRSLSVMTVTGQGLKLPDSFGNLILVKGSAGLPAS